MFRFQDPKKHGPYIAAFFYFFFAAFSSLSAQQYLLSGKVSSKKESLPFTSILVKGSTIATTSNIEGNYSLKLNPGRYELVFQYIGFKKKTVPIEIRADQKLDVLLEEESISLTEVEIKAGEDPANPIMRAAIKRREFHLNQVKSYSCNAYIKGLQRIITMPKNIVGLLKLFGGEPSDTGDIRGIIYLSESESRYFFDKPNEKEIMYSSKISGDNRSFSFNKLTEMNYNFYNNLVEMGNLSGRPFISPLNNRAFLFYKFYLQGTYEEEGRKIHKIKIVPKSSTDPCFTGMLYIVDGTWQISSVDVQVTKEVKIQFVDTLNIRQLFAPTFGDSIWMPIAYNFSFNFKVFGFEGGGYFNAHLSDFERHPKLEKNFFKNEVLVVKDSANAKDSSYWTSHRAIPLTLEEAQDYLKKDSIRKIRETDFYRDSVDAVTNKLRFRDFLLGYHYTKTKTNFSLSLPGIITNGVQYNTVEGLNLSYKFSADKLYQNKKSLNLNGRMRYGFANKLWGAEVGANALINQKKRTVLGFKIKSITEQFNRQEPLIPLVNSIYTLLRNDNFMKLYRETGGQFYYATEITNGYFFSGVLRYVQRDPLVNHTNLLLVDDPKKLFTSNDPQNSSNQNNPFASNRALTAEINFLIRFKQKYNTLPDQKVIIGSRYPRINISYRKAIPALLATTDYDLLLTQVTDAIKLGIFGSLRYRLEGGYYLRNKNLSFMDYKHFGGNQTILQTFDYLSTYRLLPYYQFSTQNWYVEAHAEQHFKGLLFSRIPLLRKSKTQELIGFHFLANDLLKQYYEINFGLERLWNVLRVDYVLGYGNGPKLKQGFTLSLDFSF